MALQKQVVSIPLTRGLDTKTDPVLLPQGELESVTNARFGLASGLSKRNGYANLPTQTSAGVSITGPGNGIANFNNQLVTFVPNAAYSLSENQDSWSQIGNSPTGIGIGNQFTNFGVTKNQIFKSSVSYFSPDSATLNGVTCYAFNAQTGSTSTGLGVPVLNTSVTFALVDESTGSTFQTTTIADCQNPRVISTGGFFYVFVTTKTNGLQCAVISVADPQNPVTLRNVISGALYASPFDVVLSGTEFYSVYYNGTTLELSKFSVNLSGFSTVTLQSVATGAHSISLAVTAAGNIALGIANVSGAQEVIVGFYNATTLANINSYIVDSSASFVPLISISPIGSDDVLVFYQVEGTAATTSSPGAPRQIRKAIVVNTVGSLEPPQILLRNAAIAGKQVTVNSILYLPVLFVSNDQATYFLVTVNGNPVGQFMQNNAGSYSVTGRVASPNLISGSEWQYALPELVSIDSSNGVVSFTQGIVELVLDFSDQSISGIQLGLNTQFTGPLPRIYDGSSITEQGFCNFPDSISLQANSDYANWTQTVAGTSGGGPQTSILTFPTVKDESSTTPLGFNTVGDGSLIQPGSFWIWQNVSYFYYVVDGVGSDPFPTFGGGKNRVNISSRDTAAAIAAKTIVAINGDPVVSLRTTLTQPEPNQIQMITSQLGAGQIIYQNVFGPNEFTIYPAFVETGTRTDIIVCPPASLIAPSSYFTIWSNAFSNYYVWFDKFDLAEDQPPSPDPAPSGYLGGIRVLIGPNDDAATVAAEVNTAINSAYVPVLISNVLYNNVTLQQVTTGVGPFSALGVPVNVNVGVGLGSGSGESNGTSNPLVDSYQYSAIYERIDASGQVHRSAPSVPVTIGIPTWNTQSEFQITVTVPALQITNSPATSVIIYRTQANGNIFYRITPIVGVDITSPNQQDFVRLLDNVTDVELAGNQTLYTTGGVTESSQAPSSTFLCLHQDRLWSNADEDPFLLWYSLQFQNGVEVQWSDLQTIRVDSVGGPIVAMASMDSNLIIFCESRIWLISGYGPDSTGAGAQFGAPQQVSTAAGCRDPGSLALTPDGIIFKSNKGFYLLDRGMGCNYLPQPFLFESDIVSAATVVPNATEVRFLSASGTTLSYDYYFKQWSQFSNHQGISSTIFNGLYTYLRASSVSGAINVYQEDVGGRLDDATGYPMVVTTGWIKMVGIQGFARIWKNLWKGFFPGVMTVEASYDYPGSGVPSDTATMTPSTAGPGGPLYGLALGAYGAETPYGGGSILPYNPIYQFRVFNGTQKCEGVQFIIQDVAPYCNWTLTAVDIEIGAKNGAYKKLGSVQSI